MRKTLTTAALVFALSCHAFAGEMATPGSPTPPPATTTAMQEPTDAAQEPVANTTTEDGTQGSLVQIVLELLTVLPSLL